MPDRGARWRDTGRRRRRGHRRVSGAARRRGVRRPPPAVQPVAVYPTRIADGQVEIDVDG